MSQLLSMALISFHETLFRAQYPLLYPLLPPWSFSVPPPSAPLGFNCPIHTLYCPRGQYCPHCEPCSRPTLLHATLLCSTVSCTPLNFPAIPPCPFIGFFSSLPTPYFLLSLIFSPLTLLSLQVPSGLTSCSDMEHNSSLQQSSSKVGVFKSTDVYICKINVHKPASRVM